MPGSATLATCGEKFKHLYVRDNERSTTFILPDGRKLGYAEWGSPKGKAILYFHGIPGSRIEGMLFDEVAANLNARLITIDRPGIGWSSPHPERTILDHTKDAEHLAEYLSLEAFGVLGISGGGPYALACAYAMPPEKLKAVAIVCGIGAPDMSKQGMGLTNRAGWTLCWPHLPSIVRRHFKKMPAFNLALDDQERFDLEKKDFEKKKSKQHPKDIEVAKNNEATWMYLRSSREFFSDAGFEAVLQDGKLLSSNWGFRLEDIRSDLPVQLLYGSLDKNVALAHGKQTASRIGVNASLRVEEETHSSLTMNQRESFMKDLVAVL